MLGESALLLLAPPPLLAPCILESPCPTAGILYRFGGPAPRRKAAWGQG